MASYLTQTTALASAGDYMIVTNPEGGQVGSSVGLWRSEGGGDGTQCKMDIYICLDEPQDYTTWHRVAASVPLVGGAQVTVINYPHSAIKLQVVTVSGSVNCAFSIMSVAG